MGGIVTSGKLIEKEGVILEVAELLSIFSLFFEDWT